MIGGQVLIIQKIDKIKINKNKKIKKNKKFFLFLKMAKPKKQESSKYENVDLKTYSIESLMSKVKELIETKKIIDIKISSLKRENNYSSLSKDLTKVKEEIYNYMLEHNLNEINGIKIDDFKPSKVKKEERNEKKIERIASILDPIISDEDSRLEISEQIVENI